MLAGIKEASENLNVSISIDQEPTTEAVPSTPESASKREELLEKGQRHLQKYLTRSKRRKSLASPIVTIEDADLAKGIQFHSDVIMSLFYLCFSGAFVTSKMKRCQAPVCLEMGYCVCQPVLSPFKKASRATSTGSEEVPTQNGQSVYYAENPNSRSIARNLSLMFSEERIVSESATVEDHALIPAPPPLPSMRNGAFVNDSGLQKLQDL